MASPAGGPGATAWWRSTGARFANQARDGVKQFWRDLTVSEMSGAMGDLGTFLPLAVGLTKAVGLDLGTTLLFSGAYNVITGAMFGIPMPVQVRCLAALSCRVSNSK